MLSELKQKEADAAGVQPVQGPAMKQQTDVKHGPSAGKRTLRSNRPPSIAAIEHAQSGADERDIDLAVGGQARGRTESDDKPRAPALKKAKALDARSSRGGGRGRKPKSSRAASDPVFDQSNVSALFNFPSAVPGDARRVVVQAPVRDRGQSYVAFTPEHSDEDEEDTASGMSEPEDSRERKRDSTDSSSRETLAAHKFAPGFLNEMKARNQTMATYMINIKATFSEQRNWRECMSIASVIDEVMVSAPGFVTTRAFEMMVRRFNAVQIADDTGEWAVADTLELGRTSKLSISSSELELIMSHTNRSERLRYSFTKKSGRRRRGGRRQWQDRSADKLNVYGVDSQSKQSYGQRGGKQNRGGGQPSGGSRGRGSGLSGGPAYSN